ncbi:putative house-cleaning noncanonical NTP pyrophosphatase (MazG superfamily) [Actinomadura pelletieri DSM 43383]|uniref:Putative house-cleaning noncanonical NTP pyrophosphatase (MazG superfamily) n=1 Tax=Actinomadura pelletieri DSM 43383 TaxID=1120940 RepID=A0A495QMR0_9ACTN|nr:putative house-cleaning noncanonical NTP pyrophosphatase (MazG superfamily) [Actinomadura pelletieri DSM 43383]
MERVLADVAAERQAQDRMWGLQDFPDGSGPEFTERAEGAKRECAAAATRGELTWRHVLTEEFYEALAESDPEALRTELVQTAAVAVKWIQSLDLRHGTTTRQSKGGTEKLVRDRIPEIIRKSGRVPQTRIAHPDEYVHLLRAKLYEEVGEYAASGDPEELADVLEVLHALAALHGVTPAELEKRRSAKAAIRGAFSDRIVLHQP